MTENIAITYEPTPNPESLKFLVSKEISSEIAQFSAAALAKRSPLASKILSFPWAKGVFIGKNFVTVTKEEWVEWEMLKDPLSAMIEEHVMSGAPMLLPKTQETQAVQEAQAGAAAVAGAGDGKASGKEAPKGQEDSAPSEAERTIKDILQREIQPAVAMDGGHIEFVSYKDGKVYVNLQGACSGCPSAAYTLKEGIEARLRQALPEIEEIVPV